jgi:hypothetical protein
MAIGKIVYGGGADILAMNCCRQLFLFALEHPGNKIIIIIIIIIIML